MCEIIEEPSISAEDDKNDKNEKYQAKLKLQLIQLIEEIRQPLTVIMIVSDQEYSRVKDQNSKNTLNLVLKSAEEIKVLTDQLYELAFVA